MVNKTYQEVRKRIFIAAKDVCGRKGAFALEVRVVTEKAGIGESTFYGHYSGVEELMFECRETIIEAIVGAVGSDESLVGDAELDESLEIVFQRMLVRFYRKREVLNVLFAAENMETVMRVFKVMKEFVERAWPKYEQRRLDRLFRICEVMIIAEILEWKRERYRKEEIEKRARHLAWMVRNTPRIYGWMVEE